MNNYCGPRTSLAEHCELFLTREKLKEVYGALRGLYWSRENASPDNGTSQEILPPLFSILPLLVAVLQAGTIHAILLSD